MFKDKITAGIDRVIQAYGTADKFRTYEAVKHYLNGERITCNEYEDFMRYVVKKIKI
jgi:hypothetical protein